VDDAAISRKKRDEVLNNIDLTISTLQQLKSIVAEGADLKTLLANEEDLRNLESFAKKCLTGLYRRQI